MWDSRRKVREPKEENVTLGPAVRDGEHVFGVAHIFASLIDTFIIRNQLLFFFYYIHVTDLFGRETLVCITGGVKVKADRDESSPYAAMLAAQDVCKRCKKLDITAFYIKLRATGTDFNPSYLCKNDFDFHIFMFGTSVVLDFEMC
ncbi:hypothetical protein ACOSP7_013985 [Xanthoceras sorbifolium]